MRAELRKLAALAELARQMDGFKFHPFFQEDSDRASQTRNDQLAREIRTKLETDLLAFFQEAYFEKPAGLQLDQDLMEQGGSLARGYEEFAKTHSSVEELARFYKKTKADLKLIEMEQNKRNTMRRATKFRVAAAQTGVAPQSIVDFIRSDNFVQVQDSAY